MRGVAALTVVFSHALIGFDFAFYDGVATPGHNPGNAELAGWPFLLPLTGNYAVGVFFVLSGFVLAASFSRTRLSAVALTVKRTLRLGIPILAVSLFAWAIVASGLAFNAEAQPITQSWWLGKQTPPAADFITALRDGVYGALIGLPNATDYDSSLWTMSIEFMGSLLLIVVFFAMRPFRGHRNANGWLIVAFLAIGVLGHFLYLCLFAFGAALRLANLRDRLKGLRGLNWTMAALLIAGVFLGTIPYAQTRGPWLDWLVAHALVHEQSGWQAQDGPFRGIPDATFWHAAGALLTIIAVDNWPPLRTLLNRPTAQFLGKISFPLYLLHVPVLLSVGCGAFLVLIGAGVNPALGWTLAMVLFAGVACLLSWLATPLIEQPAVDWSADAARYCDRLGERLWTRISGRPFPRTVRKS